MGTSVASMHITDTSCSLANPLYVQAISTLLPTTPDQAKAKPPVQDRCQGVLFAGSLATQLTTFPFCSCYRELAPGRRISQLTRFSSS